MNTQNEPAKLYLELMRKTLSYALWPDPGKPLEAVLHHAPALLRFPARLVARLFRTANLGIVHQIPYTDAQREAGNFWPAQAHSMVGPRRLENIQFCVESVLKDEVPGDLIETGVWRGGSCILMRAVLAAHGVKDRRVWVADSFEGLPKPDAEKYPQDQGDPHHAYDYLAVSQTQVAENFRKYGLLDDQVKFLKGWFKDTLPTAPIEKLAVMRLDGDMYESTMDALNALYGKLSKGGYCIIDDYALHNCKQAVEDFRAKHRIESPLLEIDWSGRYWRKV
jgi:O-methyltransferase